MAKRNSAALLGLLENWIRLNAGLMKLPEADVVLLLAHERSNRNRFTFVSRLHSRFTKLRRERERRELAK